MTYIESQNDTYIGFAGNGKRARQRVNLTFFRWPDRWLAWPLPERAERLADHDSPARLFCLPSHTHQFDPARRRDYLAVSLSEDELGDKCALECMEAGFRLYRKSTAQDVTGVHEDDAPEPPIECPFTAERIDRWFAQEDQP